MSIQLVDVWALELVFFFTHHNNRNTGSLISLLFFKTRLEVDCKEIQLVSNSKLWQSHPISFFFSTL